MHSIIFAACISVTAASDDVVEIWQGKLEAEAFQKGKRTGDVLDLTLKIKEQQGTKFTGEWIEGDRALEISGRMAGRRMTFKAERVLRGQWDAGVVSSLTGVGSIEGSEMKGQFAGAGSKAARRGKFTLKKQSPRYR
jgi:hypothetical protein